MFIDVDGIGIHYECAGEGPDLIMLHGNGEDLHLFDGSAAILEDSYRVWRIDSRGHGLSSEVDTYHYRDMADDVASFIRIMGIKDPVLFGYSDGGIIALLVAIMHPGSVSGIIAAGANTHPSMLEPEVYRECLEWNLVHEDPRMTMMLNEPDIRVEELAGIDVPAFILAGSEDCILPEDTDRIADSIGCSRKAILEGHDHSSYIEDGTLLASLIREGTAFIRGSS